MPKTNRPRSTAVKQSRGIIRSMNRRATRADKSPQVVRKTGQPHEPTVCVRCGAVYLRKSWRHNHSLTDDQLERIQWGFCPACDEVSRQEGQGRVVIQGPALANSRSLIRSRVENISRRAMVTQPERRIVSMDTVRSDSGDALEVLTTSQKLAHRIAHELKKAFGGRTSYSWSDDGTLFAVCEVGRSRLHGKRKS